MADPVRTSNTATGSDAGAANGVAISEWRPRSIVQLAGIPRVVPRRSDVEGSLGLELPGAHRSSCAGTCAALWVGPDRWLIVDEVRDALLAAIERSASGTMAVTELSSARTVLRLFGARARDVLAKGCAVDLHPRALTAGASIVTGLARHAVVLHRHASAPLFDVYVYRSFGRDLLDWLRQAANIGE